MSAASTPDTIRQRIAAQIVHWEARRDAQGRIAIYNLPSADGGGTFEVAGINDRYHPGVAKRLATLIRSGQHAAAETEAAAYIRSYTDVVKGWHPSLAVEAYLRDTCFNRGPGGAAKILQQACGAAPDGKVGPVTRARAAVIPAAELLTALRTAREHYERRIAPPIKARAKFWKGLENRWDNALRFAQTLL